MRNLWVQTETPFATWLADLSPLRHQPESLLKFVLHVLDAGAQYQVLELLEAPLIDYQSKRDGALGPILSRLYRERDIVDLFGFTGAAMAPGHPRSSTSQATLAWYDGADELVEDTCTDLGELLSRFTPAPDAIPLSDMTHYPPLRVTGSRFEYEGLSRKPRSSPPDWLFQVRFAIHSDIWFPWIHGRAHPECDYERMFDNRELAGRHTPRLNDFLRAVGAKARELGGSWQLDPEEIGTRLGPWLSEEGISLEVEPPLVMPPEALDTEWV